MTQQLLLLLIAGCVCRTVGRRGHRGPDTERTERSSLVHLHTNTKVAGVRGQTLLRAGAIIIKQEETRSLQLLFQDGHPHAAAHRPRRPAALAGSQRAAVCRGRTPAGTFQESAVSGL